MERSNSVSEEREDKGAIGPPCSQFIELFVRTKWPALLDMFIKFAVFFSMRTFFRNIAILIIPCLFLILLHSPRHCISRSDLNVYFSIVIIPRAKFNEELEKKMGRKSEKKSDRPMTLFWSHDVKATLSIVCEFLIKFCFRIDLTCKINIQIRSHIIFQHNAGDYQLRQRKHIKINNSQKKQETERSSIH